jgi:hypothetical protein
VNDLCSHIIDQHREALRNPHKPREGRRLHFPRLWPRFNYRAKRKPKPARP